MGAYVGGGYGVVAAITSLTGWLCTFRCGKYVGAVPHDEEGVEN